MDNPEIGILRAMAWERAKGELNAVLATYRPVAGQLGGGDVEQTSSEVHEVESRIRALVAEIERAIG